MKIYTKIFIGMAVGIVVGILLGPNSALLKADLIVSYDPTKLKLLTAPGGSPAGVKLPRVETRFTLLEERGQTQLYATFADGALPVALAGDGLQAFLQIALGVAAVPAGLALVEEPEVFQHPGSLTRTAQVLWAGVHRGVQVVVTTHSLELIDRILASAGEGDLDQLTVFNLALDDGELRASRFEGVDLPQVRGELESDLR